MLREQQDPAPGDHSLELQLIYLYQDRELLQQELGCADAQEVVALVRSMQEQLHVLYREKELGPQEAQDAIAQVRRVAEGLGDLYPASELVLEYHDGGTHLRGTWKKL